MWLGPHVAVGGAKLQANEGGEVLDGEREREKVWSACTSP